MEQLLLVNPRKRRTPRRNAKGRFVKSGVATNPRKRRAKRRRNPIAAVANPKRRTVRAVRRARRSRRRNPAPLAGFGSMLMTGLQGGLGAIAVDTAIGFAPLPDTLKTGYMRHAIRAFAAVAIGQFGKMLLPATVARNMGAGAMAVVMRDVVQEVAAGAGVNLSGIGYTSPVVQFARPQMLPGMQGMGEYVTGAGTGAAAMDGMGEYVY